MLKAFKVLLVMFLVVVSFSIAAAEDNEMPYGKWWAEDNISQELALSDQEKSQLEEKFLESRRKLIDLKSAVEKEKIELEVIMNKKSADEAAIMKQFKKLEATRSDLSAERFAFVMDVRKILGFDRFQKLETTFKNYKKKGPKKKTKGHDDKAPEEGLEKTKK